ncbi:hypothetical protein ACFU7X_02415 [Streptomyces chartreusis]|uniref:hypothetical protein n=1 Tax=Streptomyces chartreusis TaxID=1969 RepID=UPI00368131E2
MGKIGGEVVEVSPGFGGAVHGDGAPEREECSHVLQMQEADRHLVAGGGFLLIVPDES